MLQFTAKAMKNTKDTSTTIFEKTENTPVPETKGSVTFRIGMKIPETFGKYSSLDVSIELSGPGDPNNFENHVNHYLERVVTFERELVNAIMVAGGQPPHFGEINEKEK